MVDVTGNDGITYTFSVDRKLQQFLDAKVIKRINNRDKDYVMLVSGYEGAGKSTFAFQVAKYVDNDFGLDQVVFTPEKFRERINSANKGQCIVYDEAVTGLTAGGSITKVGRLLKSMMMQMRQKNLMVIIVIPSVFELNKYAVLHRAMCLFHVLEKKNRHSWVGYNKRDTKNTYILGKKNHSMKIKSRFTGRFFGNLPIDEEAYKEKKQESLDEEDMVEEKVNKYSIQRDYYLKLLKEFLKTGKAVTDAQMGCKYPLSERRIQSILGIQQDGT